MGIRGRDTLSDSNKISRFRCVCKRWNGLFNERRIFHNDLALTRPQFILLGESKICSVDVNLNGPSIEVHNLPSDIPGYKRDMLVTIEYCDGLLIYFTCYGIGICNPWLRQIRWIKLATKYFGSYNGMGYDNSRNDKHYKIIQIHNTIEKAYITEFGSDAWKPYKIVSDNWTYPSSGYNVSLNETLYWVARNRYSGELFIQSFEFSIAEFKPYCQLPRNGSLLDARSLAVFKGDRFSYLEQNHNTRNIEIWVTKKKIKNGDGENVEWMNLMSVSIPIWSSLKVRPDYPPSYFIDDKSLSLVLCCLNKEEKAFIYISKGDKFREIKIDALVEDNPHHRTYFPSLVPVPTFTMSDRGNFQPVDSRFTFPKGVQASHAVGQNEWDDGLFDNVKKMYVAKNHFGMVFVKFHYSKDNVVVDGAPHGNASHFPTRDVLIADDDYIEAVEGTYTETHITSITFRMHKGNMSRYGSFNGTPFMLGGRRGSKIVGFYGKSSRVHLTALGVHLSRPPSRIFDFL